MGVGAAGVEGVEGGAGKGMDGPVLFKSAIVGGTVGTVAQDFHVFTLLVVLAGW